MKDDIVNAGPCIVPQYGAKSWSQLNMPKGTRLADIWRLCGPMVDRNLSRRPMWEVFCLVYLEALQHGSEATHSLFKDAQGKGFVADLIDAKEESKRIQDAAGIPEHEQTIGHHGGIGVDEK
jgi:hypothetical protein